MATGRTDPLRMTGGTVIITSPSSGGPRVAWRRRLVGGACVSALAIGAWGASSSVASAAPPSIEAPIARAAFVGLRVGSQGTDVTALQRALIAAGVDVRGGADGVFGPATRQAVRDFQSSRGLSVSGEVDEATSSALAADSGSGQGSSSSSTSGLSVGAKGAQVTALQKRLMDLGVYVAGGADGVFGSATERAVSQFQGWNGLSVTGVVDSATADKLDLNASTDTTTPAADPPAADPPVSDSPNGYVGLKNGSRGPLVEDLQNALMKTGLVVRGGADGVFGSATERAFTAFQGFNGLTRNGVVSERAAQLLKLGAGGSSDATPPPSSTNSFLGMSNGARGEAVKSVQRALITAGVSVRGGADGVFGNVTRSALTTYQKALGVTADGTVNQPTIDALKLGSNGDPTPLPSGSTATPPATPPTPPPTTSSNDSYVGLAVGSRGALVRELQNALMNTGLVVRGGADGIFGTATKTALKNFQSVNGIEPTGVVTERGVGYLGLGTGTVAARNPNVGSGGTSGTVSLKRFPVQGQCFFGDTWHAPRGGGRQHKGVDVIADEGNLLYAVVDGTISKFYWDQPGALAGNGLRVAQADGTYFTYLHMLGFTPGIELGTTVKAGDVIGFVGNTGSSSTPHLHFEIHPGGGAAVNPYPYIKAIDDCSNTTRQYQGDFS